MRQVLRREATCDLTLIIRLILAKARIQLNSNARHCEPRLGASQSVCFIYGRQIATSCFALLAMTFYSANVVSSLPHPLGWVFPSLNLLHQRRMRAANLWRRHTLKSD